MNKTTSAILGAIVVATMVTVGSGFSRTSTTAPQINVSGEMSLESGELIASRYYLRKRTSNFYNRAKSRSVRRSSHFIG